MGQEGYTFIIVILHDKNHYCSFPQTIIIAFSATILISSSFMIIYFYWLDWFEKSLRIDIQILQYGQKVNIFYLLILMILLSCCIDYACGRNVSLLTNCRTQLIFCKVTLFFWKMQGFLGKCLSCKTTIVLSMSLYLYNSRFMVVQLKGIQSYD